jgi:hypothetical protein
LSTSGPSPNKISLETPLKSTTQKVSYDPLDGVGGLGGGVVAAGGGSLGVGGVSVAEDGSVAAGTGVPPPPLLTVKQPKPDAASIVTVSSDMYTTCQR